MQPQDQQQQQQAQPTHIAAAAQHQQAVRSVADEFDSEGERGSDLRLRAGVSVVSYKASGGADK